MNLHKILCFLNHHSWEYTNKTNEFLGYTEKIRSCIICDKRQRKYIDTWLPPRPKVKPLNQVRKDNEYVKNK